LAFLSQAERIFACDRSNDAVLRKDVLFGG